MHRRATSRDFSRFKGQSSFPEREDGDVLLVGFASRNLRMGHPPAWMRSAGTSTSVTPRKENKSFTRYLGGCSEVCFTIWPTASVTAAWNITPSACRPARFTRTSWPGWNMTPPEESSSCETSNASRFRWVAASAGVRGGIRTLHLNLREEYERNLGLIR